ncbi:MAG: hypothetical protein KKF44_11300 [Nanoarchaeota archaeon]|nr:hypothetical protein [Nanoarchaeota archaeon]
MNKKAILVLFIFILTLSVVHAQESKDLSEKIATASTIVEEFFDGIPMEDIVIIKGSAISMEDKLLFNMVKGQVDSIRGIEIDTEKVILKNPEKIAGKSLVLLGSQKTNTISKQLALEGKVTDVEEILLSPVILKTGNMGAEAKVLIIYSKKEVKNVENSAVSKSPLNKVMDKKYVPWAATFLSILMLYLWNILGKTFMNLLNDFVTSVILQKKTKGKTIKKERKHHIKAHEFINRNEVLAFIIFVIVFSLTMSWTWSGNLADFKRMFFLNLVIVFVISFLREFIRLVFCYKHRLHSEYVLWPFGTLVTIISTYLGNTFSMVSYTLLDEDVADEKVFGKGSFMIALLTYFLVMIGYMLNIFWPSVVFQMIFVYSIMVLFIELFPMGPMAGDEIRKWNFPVWLISYIIVIASYIGMNFTVYV